MIKDNQKRLNRLHILLDILVVCSLCLAWFIVVSGKVLPVDVEVLKPQIYFMALVFIVPVYLVPCQFVCMYPSGYRDGVRNLPISVKSQHHWPDDFYIRAVWSA